MLKVAFKYIYLLIFILSGLQSSGQLVIPNQVYGTFLNSYYQDKDHQHHTVKPFSYFENKLANDSLTQELQLEGGFFDKWLGNIIFNDDLASYKTEDFEVNLNGYINYHFGNDEAGYNFQAARGVNISGHIQDFFAIQTVVASFDGILYPQYILEHIDYKHIDPDPAQGTASRIVLGQGVGFPNPPNVSERNQLYTTAVMSYMPNKFFRFDGGYGKNFIGDGYRSLFLSDNAANYPFLKLTTSLGKIQFTNIYAQMRHLQQVYIDDTYMKKYAAFHHLSWNITDKINVGFFETVIYSDSLGNRGFELDYLVPYVLLRSLEHSIGSRGGNAMLGINASAEVSNGVTVYGQFLIDEFNTNFLFNNSGWHANKFGGQLGIKSFDVFGVKNLYLQGEFNRVRPFTYSHTRVSQAYESYNQPLAHPLVSNFTEFLAFARYRKGRLYGTVQLMLANQGLDTAGVNYGNDLYKSYRTHTQEFDNRIGQGVNTSTFYTNLSIGYIVNPKNGLVVELTYTYRDFKPEAEGDKLKANTTGWIGLNVKHLLFNHYYDL